MKAKELIEILNSVNPEDDVLVSTVSYYERKYYAGSYERGTPQKTEGVSILNGVIVINGGKERIF